MARHVAASPQRALYLLTEGEGWRFESALVFVERAKDPPTWMRGVMVAYAPRGQITHIGQHLAFAPIRDRTTAVTWIAAEVLEIEPIPVPADASDLEPLAGEVLALCRLHYGRARNQAARAEAAHVGG